MQYDIISCVSIILQKNSKYVNVSISMKNTLNKIHRILENSTLITQQQKEWIYYLLENSNLSKNSLSHLLTFLEKEEPNLDEYWEYIISDENAQSISSNLKWNKAKETVAYIRKLEAEDEENQEDLEDLLDQI